MTTAHHLVPFLNLGEVRQIGTKTTKRINLLSTACTAERREKESPHDLEHREARRENEGKSLVQQDSW